jgi:NhaA family Na+:H+ antiporter
MDATRPRSALRAFISSEASGGIVLMAAAALALVVANSPLSASYFAVLETYVAGLSVLHWVNDGLMALFFLLVGLEVKRELVDGQLSTWERRILPGAAAAAGMAVPALIFAAVNWGDPLALRGWAIPAATDIAFALAVLALVGSRAPVSLKVFLTAVAIIDDLGAIVIIALFYTAELALPALGAALAGLGVLVILNRRGVTALWPYLLTGLLIWWLVLQSGVHATLAGVAVALTIPLRPSPARPDDAASPLHRLEHKLHSPVAFAVVPIFGFANAGLSFEGLSAGNLIQPLPLGIALGLFLGKQLGIFGTVWVLVKLNLADVPANATWRQVYGVSLLCGIGFTMSLFIGGLAFDGAGHLSDHVKIGVLSGSILSALTGYALLRTSRSVPGGDN